MKDMFYIVVIVGLLGVLLVGCTNNRFTNKQADLHLICDPIEANGCIGFAKDKSIMLITEEKI